MEKKVHANIVKYLIKRSTNQRLTVLNRGTVGISRLVFMLQIRTVGYGFRQNN